MFKKLLTMFLIVLAVMIVMASTVVASDEVHSVESTTNQGLTIYTEQVSDGAWNYAIARFMFYYNSWVISNPDILRGESTFLGMPFTIQGTPANVYYFPVITDGVIIGVFIVGVDVIRTGESGQTIYFGTLTSGLADELNMIRESNYSSPVLLAFDNGNLFIQTSHEIELISPSPWGGEPEWVSYDGLRAFQRGNDLQVVAPLEKAITNFNHPVSAYTATLDYATFLEEEYIQPFSIPSNQLNTARFRTEQQGQRPWCSAYAAALIFRFLANNTTNPTAYSLMREVWGPEHSMPYFQLRQFSFHENDVVMVARTRGINASRTGRLTPLGVVNEINRGRPIYMVGYLQPRPGATGAHAWVIRGFTTHMCPIEGISVTSYSVWNPWNMNRYDAMDGASNIIFTVDGRSWQWMRSITF